MHGNRPMVIALQELVGLWYRKRKINIGLWKMEYWAVAVGERSAFKINTK